VDKLAHDVFRRHGLHGSPSPAISLHSKGCRRRRKFKPANVAWTSQGVIAPLTRASFSLEAAIATSHTTHLVASHVPVPTAITSGFQRALLASSISLIAAAAIAMRTSNTRGEIVPGAQGEALELAQV
jgi:hypothetical protein